MENSTTYNDLLSMKIPKVSYQIDPFFPLSDFFSPLFMKNFFQFRFWFINWIFSTFLFLSTLNPRKAGGGKQQRWQGITHPPSHHRQKRFFFILPKIPQQFSTI
jgi:hypothetical protein